jgi:hypothetical protein
MNQSLRYIFLLALLMVGTGQALASSCSSNGSSHSSGSCNFNDFKSCDFDSKSCDFNDCNSCDSDCDEKCFSCCQAPVKTHVHFRSQGANTARELVGWQWELNKPYMCENYGAAYISYEYQRSFRGERIARQLFGGTTLRFAGSAVANRDPRNELLAENFGLARNFRGSVSFCPRIENHIVDLGYYMGLDCWWQGAYLRIHFPITHTRWNLRACEKVEQTSPNIEPCFVSETSVPAIQTLQEALSGTTPFGSKTEDWCAGRIDFCRRTRTGLADIDVIFGYNWLNDDCYHLGIYAQAVLPTGRKARNLFLFDPVTGNGGFFELGAGLSAHAVLWSCEDQNLSVFVEGNVTHLFRSKQCRLFDFCKNGAFSRYLLLKEFDSNGTVNTFNGNLVSATCFNNRLVNVRVNVKGDASIKLAYRWCGWGVDIGYNIYGHSKEEIEFRCDDECCDFDNRKFCIKGTEGVCCFSHPIIDVSSDGTDLKIFPNGATLPDGSDVPYNCPTAPLTNYVVTQVTSNACQPNATAFEGRPMQVTTITDSCNVLLDPASPAVPASGAPTQGTAANNTQLAANLISEGFILCNNSAPVTFLSVNDLNKKSGEAASVLTHKIFAHFNYTWYDECGWNPHIGVGGEVEFDRNRDKFNNCDRSGLNIWGIWVKGGVSF